MAEKKGFNTIFQTLDNAISGNWNTYQEPKHTNSYNLTTNGDTVLYRTHDKDKYEKQKLELQQNSYLNDRWVKANVDLSVQAFAGLNNVKLMYRDADLMDSFPEIGAALDIVSEEATTLDPKGQVITVSSKSDRIKAILEDLFVNRLDIQVTAQMIIRAMCKYGNNFMLLNVDHKNGVMGWRQLPVFNVERLENGIQNPYGGSNYLANGNDNSDLSTKFVWTDERNTQVPFRNWQIAHFRLINNSLLLPYGCLVGDTRIETEFGYKEMSNIQINDKVWTFNIQTQKKELGTVTMFMPKGEKDVYKVSTFHNDIEGTDDHKLLVYQDNNLVYKEIKDIKIGDLLIIDNSYNKCNEKIKIIKDYPSIKEANLQKTMTWWTDYIDFIPDYVDEEFAKFFGFMLGDGWITNGKYIYFATGEYEKFNIEFAKYLEKITNHKARFKKPLHVGNSDYEYSSCLVCSKCLSLIMYRMGFIDGFNKKRIPNWVFSANDSIKKAFLNGLMISDGSYNIDKYDILRCSLEMCNEQLIKDAKILVQSLGYKSSLISSRNRIGKKSTLKSGYNIISKNTTYYFYFYESYNKQEKKYELANRLENGFKTEKVREIRYVGKKQTYDFTVSNENSNFFANGIVTHNCSYLNAARRHWRMLSLMEDCMLIYRMERSIERRVFKIYVGAIDDADVQAYVQEIANNFKRTPIIDPMTGQIDLRKNIMAVDQDIFIPTRTENASNPIETLSAAQNLTAIDDIKYIQNKVCTALRIPKSFLNFEESEGQGGNLALEDIRFTRTVNRIQQAFLMELTKVASIHLYLLGFEDDLTNFSLSMTNPSTQAEQLQIDTITKRIQAVQTAVADPGNGIPLMSLQRALKEIMKWSDKDIQDNFEEMRLEKAIANELQLTSQIIKRTGIFDTVDRIYGEPGAQYQETQGQGDGQDPMGAAGGGGGMPPMGGSEGDFGNGLDELGNEGSNDEGNLTGTEGEMPIEDAAASNDNGEAQTLQEVKKKTRKKRLTESTDNKISIPRAKVYNDAILINEEYNSMIKSIDKFLGE